MYQEFSVPDMRLVIFQLTAEGFDQTALAAGMSCGLRFTFQVTTTNGLSVPDAVKQFKQLVVTAIYNPEISLDNIWETMVHDYPALALQGEIYFPNADLFTQDRRAYALGIRVFLEALFDPAYKLLKDLQRMDYLVPWLNCQEHILMEYAR